MSAADKTAPEQAAELAPEHTERPTSAMLRRVVAMAAAEMERTCNEAAEEERELLGLPNTARLDVKRMVWLIPRAED